MNNNITSTAPQGGAALFLHIAGQGAALASPFEFARWLQGDVQRWLPHDAMVVASVDVRGGPLHHEVFSGDPQLRSLAAMPVSMGPLLGYLRDCWVAAQQAPCQVGLAGCELLLRDCTIAQRHALGAMRAAVVHGTIDRARGTQRIFAALTADADPAAGAGAALKLLLPFMDTAFGRISTPAAPTASDGETGGAAITAQPPLSEREREIMQWVALGKTNPEIGCILSISEFTVKNHMKSIFGKLDVTNRAQAVAKLARLTAHA